MTPSGYQVRRAQQVARQRGDADRATFVCRALHDEMPAGNDVALAIEALGHTDDLARALTGVRRALVAGGVFVWVEDLLREPLAGDEDVLQLARDWRSPPLRDVASARAAIDDAGLRVVEEIDLTAQVPRRDVAAVDASRARLRRWRWVAPPGFARRLHAAFHGGFALERLYARGVACYRYLMLEPRPAS